MDMLTNMIVVSNRFCCERDFTAQLERICRQKPVRFILREKDLDDAAYEKLLMKAIKLCRTYGVPLSVNSRPHIAKKYGTGLHLSYSDFVSAAAHPIFTGVSVHTPKEAQKAAKLGADYIIAGHIFATNCKKGVPPRGLDFLKDVCTAVFDTCRTDGRAPIPVYGIGGITPERLPLLFDTGAAGGCMMSAAMRL